MRSSHNVGDDIQYEYQISNLMKCKTLLFTAMTHSRWIQTHNIKMRNFMFIVTGILFSQVIFFSFFLQNSDDPIRNTPRINIKRNAFSISIPCNNTNHNNNNNNSGNRQKLCTSAARNQELRMNTLKSHLNCLQCVKWHKYQRLIQLKYIHMRWECVWMCKREQIKTHWLNRWDTVIKQRFLFLFSIFPYLNTSLQLPPSIHRSICLSVPTTFIK